MCTKQDVSEKVTIQEDILQWFNDAYGVKGRDNAINHVLGNYVAQRLARLFREES